MLSPVKMRQQGIRSRGIGVPHAVRPVVLVVVAAACLLSVAALAVAEPASVPLPPGKTDGWTQVIKDGFTDPGNAYAGSSAEYKGYLFVSTIAGKTGELFSGSDKEGGDILRTKDGLTWEQIGEPGLGYPHNSTFRFVIYEDKLYAVSDSDDDHGLEIWVTSDGSEFRQIAAGGLGDKNNTTAAPFVLNDRLILGVNNNVTRAQIWVSDDGESFRQVATGGMGGKNNSAISPLTAAEGTSLLFRGKLYVGAADMFEGGEIWRTADGLEWERVADNGLERSGNALLLPCAVFQDRLYVVGWAVSQDSGIGGVEVYRTSDGTTWEKVVSDGFGVGEHQNIYGLLTEYKGELYLSGTNYDPRIMSPDQPSEKFAPQGFQLYRSPDGKQWTQVGEDGFGVDSSYTAWMAVHGEDAYMGVCDYHRGEQLWRSSDGENWELMFQESVPSWFAMGGGSVEFQGHLLWYDNDLERGFEVWRTDVVVVAEATTTTLTGDTSGATTVTSSGGSMTTAMTTGEGTGGGGDAQSGDGAEGTGSGGLSGGILALIIVLAVVAVAAIGLAAYLLGRSRSRATGGPAPPIDPSPPSPGFCSYCGSAVTPDSTYCAGCGRKL